MTSPPHHKTVFMYSPQERGGHAEYTHELLTAIASLPESKNINLQLITTTNLDSAYHSNSYEVKNILPQQRPRTTFLTPAHFAINRYKLFRKREKRLVQHVASSSGQKICHLQELTPWNASQIIKHLKKSGAKVVYTVHNIHPHHTFWLPRSIIESQLRNAWKHCDGLLVHTEDLKVDLQNFLGTNNPQIFVTPHGTWKATTKTPPSERLRRIKENSIHKILIFGHLRPNKAVDSCIEAMKHLPMTHLTIAGQADRSVANAITSRIQNLSLSNRVTFHDSYVSNNDVENLFNDHDICLLAYRNFHAQSGVLYKAAAFGVPLVVSDVGALGNTVRTHQLGEVINETKPKAIADAIHRLLDITRYKNSLNGLETLTKTNTWAHTAIATTKAYNCIN